MAVGAYLGGKVPVALMEGSGLGYCGLVLARAQIQRTPCSCSSATMGRSARRSISTAPSAPPPRGSCGASASLTWCSPTGPRRPASWQQALITVLGQKTVVGLLVPPYLFVGSLTMQRGDLVSLFAELRTQRASHRRARHDLRRPLSGRSPGSHDLQHGHGLCHGDLPRTGPRARPSERVVALEGDGSALAGLGVLSTIGRYAPPNLVVVVFHNGVYASCGDGQVPTAAAATTDLAGGRPSLRDQSAERRGRGDARGGAQGAERRADRARAVDHRGPHRASGPLAGGPAAAAPRPRGDGRRVQARDDGPGVPLGGAGLVAGLAPTRRGGQTSKRTTAVPVSHSATGS